jgi:DNA-binding response OmpR family regulator
LRKLPVILLTRSDDQAEVTKAMELGFDRFIKKPLNYEKITKAVNATGYFFSIVAIPQKSE